MFLSTVSTVIQAKILRIRTERKYKSYITKNSNLKLITNIRNFMKVTVKEYLPGTFVM